MLQKPPSSSAHNSHVGSLQTLFTAAAAMTKFIASPDHPEDKEKLEEVNLSDCTTEPVVSQNANTNKSPPPTATPTSNRAKADNKVSSKMVDRVLENSLAFETEAQVMERAKIKDMLGGVEPEEVLTGMAFERKNRKDMASHTFWNTQPVARFGTNRLSAYLNFVSTIID